jgi:hypothetical protein
MIRKLESSLNRKYHKKVRATAEVAPIELDFSTVRDCSDSKN